MKRMLRVLAVPALLAGAGCGDLESAIEEPRNVLVVGVDVSGSFRNSPRYGDAVTYLAHYIYGRVNGMGGLEQATALFVGSVGGDTPGETKAFHPIHDFEGKGPEQIAADLEAWFPAQDRLTDFNAFFARIGELVQRQGLILSPINVVIVSDGVPDLEASAGAAMLAATPVDGVGGVDPYRTIDLSPLEYLSRAVTVRLLYPAPTVAANWERGVERRRVRIWTTDSEVMAGWSNQLLPDAPPEEQTRLWKWTADNVDFRVRARIL